MAVRIKTNIAAIRATSDFSRIERDNQTRRARLISGLSVNSAKDGGARLSVSEGMRAEIGGLTVGNRNAESALDLLRMAEGAMNEISAVLIRMRELAVESANATLNNSNRESLDAEFNQLKEHIDRIAKLANFNDQILLSGFGNEVDADASTAVLDSVSTGVKNIKVSGVDGGTYTFIDDGEDNALTLGNGAVTQTINFGTLTVGDEVAAGTTLVANFDLLGIQVELAGAGVEGAAGSYADGALDGRTIVIEEGTGGTFQLGSDAVPADRLEYDIRDMTVSSPIINLSQVSVGTRETARAALTKIDQAIGRSAKERGVMGAVMNRLKYTIDFTANAIEHVHASESTVRDTDLSWETWHLARNQIVAQTSMAVLMQSRIPINMAMDLLQQNP